MGGRAFTYSRGMVRDQDGKVVADIGAPTPSNGVDADGHLLAAAPDLLEALDGLRCTRADVWFCACGFGKNCQDPRCERARAAIAKARGQT